MFHFYKTKYKAGWKFYRNVRNVKKTPNMTDMNVATYKFTINVNNFKYHCS